MEYTQLGRTGVLVSKLCLGTMNFGPQASEADSFQIMDKALELGINFFDTANTYGWTLGEGITEQIVGHWLAQGGGRRDQIVLATKVFGKMGEGPNEKRLSAFHIRKACEDSLKRLQTDHIDLYQMHHVDRLTPWEEIWQAMEILVRDGKVIYVGSSNFAAWNIAQAHGAAVQRRFMGLVCEQSIYNLINRMVELEVIPACREFGLGLIPYSPLARGLLGGIIGRELHGRRGSQNTQKELEKYRSQIQHYEELCKEIGEDPSTVALSWLLHNPVVTAPIIGPRTLEQLEASQKALTVSLHDDTLARLNMIFPGPGGEAPEAYAW
jgi:aryl-alcohol dehydrogenase-like predicted oxidoreductase